MRVIHGRWLIEIDRHRRRTILRFFGDGFTTVALLNDQPGVVGVNRQVATTVYQVTARFQKRVPAAWRPERVRPSAQSLSENGVRYPDRWDR